MEFNKAEHVQFWSNKAAEVLKGKRIVEARYMNDKEMEMMDWTTRPLCFFLEDGTACILSADDEGNAGGSLFYGRDGVLPLLS